MLQKKIITFFLLAQTNNLTNKLGVFIISLETSLLVSRFYSKIIKAMTESKKFINPVNVT